MTHHPELMTGVEARRYLGMIPAVWMELLESEQLPRPVRIDRRLMWRRADLDQWIQSREPVEFAE